MAKMAKGRRFQKNNPFARAFNPKGLKGSRKKEWGLLAQRAALARARAEQRTLIPTPEERDALAPVAEKSLEHMLGYLFLRLGPPPEPTELRPVPAGGGDGGAQQ